MSLVTIHPKRIRWMKNPWDVVSGFKHDNRFKCHRGIVSQWTFQVGLNVTVDETWVDVTSRHPCRGKPPSPWLILDLHIWTFKFGF
jgi:hypothetical protein